MPGEFDEHEQAVEQLGEQLEQLNERLEQLDEVEEFRKSALEAHNYFRDLHSAKELTESQLLNDTAQSFAERLLLLSQLQISDAALNGECGECITRRTGKDEVVISGKEVTTLWYKDVEKFNFDTGDGKAGSFTQIVWQATESVGFGLAFSENRKTAVAVAQYQPAGNIRGKFLENVRPSRLELGESTGSSISGSGISHELVGFRVHERKVDFDEMKDNGAVFLLRRETITYVNKDGHTQEKLIETRQSQRKSDSLKSSDSHRRTLSTLSTTTTESAGSSNQQLADADLNSSANVTDRRRRFRIEDKAQRKFAKRMLESINKLRKKHGSKPLTLNVELSGMAQDYAEQLPHLPEILVKNETYLNERVGQNLARTYARDCKAEDVAKQWYKEVSNFKFSFEPDDVARIGNFTQLVWRNSQELGVGKATAISDNGRPITVVVCNFYPSGNVIGEFASNVLPAAAAAGFSKLFA